MKQFDDELTSGSVARSVWKLVWPVVLLNLVNGLHGFCDHILIGRFLPSPDNAANAAIGIAWQVFLVVVVFIASLFQGMSVLIARYAGKRDRDMMSEVAYNAFLSSVYILVFIVAPMGYFVAPYLLQVVQAEPQVVAHALPYLRILFTCGAPLFIMFMIVGAFQASGDPKTPLLLGVLSTTLNIGISFVLIVGLGPFPALGTVGAALGTVIAPLVSVSVALSLVMRRKMILQPPRRFHLLPDMDIMRDVARIGLPTGIQGVLLNLGGVFLLTFIGFLPNSSAAQAAYTICYAQLFSFVTWASFALRSASATLMGQNIGAGKIARGKAAVGVAALYGVCWAIAIGSAFWFMPEFLLGLFGATDEPILSYATTLLRVLAFSGLVLAPTLALTGGIQGAGQTKIPMVIAFATQIVLLLGICSFFYLRDTLTTTKIWLAILTTHSVRFLMTWAVFRTEAWAHTVVSLRGAKVLAEK